ncbi:MAG: 2Fe-2S iron-sulfur cluster binding domain-containing protein [Myxococcales bacterium]|nr:2Fe-2S iron-sulfur cluster binding domain-containing protein [Myxococcales bacterium]
MIHLVTAFCGDEAPGTAAAVDPWSSLLTLINAAGLPIGQSCRGVGICRSCGVRADDLAGVLTPRTAREDAAALPTGWRLACQARVPWAELVCAPQAHDPLVNLRLWHPSWGAAEPATGVRDRDISERGAGDAAPAVG